jgi:hypothetical protein
MKTIILFLLSFFLFSQSKDLRGHVIDKNNSAFPGITVTMSYDGKVIRETQTDQNGNFILKNLENKSYEFKLSAIGYEDYIFKEFYFSGHDRVFEFTFPNPCPKSKKICPENHSNKLIPIVYGLPSDKMIKDAKKGKIILGGCIVNDCSPKWFCKKHSLSF